MIQHISSFIPIPQRYQLVLSYAVTATKCHSARPDIKIFFGWTLNGVFELNCAQSASKFAPDSAHDFFSGRLHGTPSYFHIPTNPKLCCSLTEVISFYLHALLFWTEFGLKICLSSLGEGCSSHMLLFDSTVKKTVN